MKTCPRCNKTYPDTETFCEADGTALVSAGPAFAQGGGAQGSEPRIECPVCGGKAEPGEVICNFCGARLISDEEAAKALPFAPEPARAAATPPPPLRPSPAQVSQPPGEAPPIEEEAGGRSLFGLVGYIAAAIIALVAGAWFALHLSSKKPTESTTVQASPSPAVSPAVIVSGPLVALANGLPVQVLGAAASSPDRNADVARKEFDDNKGSLLDSYNRLLSSDPRLADAMMVRIHILPDGTVDKAAVRTSTTPNPSLDAEVAKAFLGWKFPATSSGSDAEADYPIIFAHDNVEQARIESELQTKLASLSPSEPPEYASAPMPAPAVSPAGAPSPEIAAVPPAPAIVPTPEGAPSVVAKPPHRAPPKLAALPKPSPSLFEVVQQKLAADRRLRRAKAYTAGGTVTLYGRVFDDAAKLLAERTVKNIPGVTGVVDTLTTDTAEWAEQEGKISRQLQNAGLDKVTVKVIGHDAYLNGQVKTDLEKQRAVTITQGAAPVTVRENLIRVEPGSMFGF